MTSSKLIEYDPRYAKHFADLNYEWIETYFAVEAEDRLALDHPQEYALAPGGNIYFVVEGSEVVGTVAVVPSKLPEDANRKVYEVAKMAVRPDCRGRGYGHQLMQACIEFARGKDADELMLVTNDRLAPALATYVAAGFEPVTEYSDQRYERGNLMLRLSLRS